MGTTPLPLYVCFDDVDLCAAAWLGLQDGGGTVFETLKHFSKSGYIQTVKRCFSTDVPTACTNDGSGKSVGFNRGKRHLNFFLKETSLFKTFHWSSIKRLGRRLLATVSFLHRLLSEALHAVHVLPGKNRD